MKVKYDENISAVTSIAEDRQLKRWYDAGQDRRTIDLSGVPHENKMRLLRAIFSVDPIETACTETICQAGIEVSE